jgi:multicomponent Na+:H+ antiporter subunit E
VLPGPIEPGPGAEGRAVTEKTRASLGLTVLLVAWWLANSGHYSLDPQHRLIAYFGVGSCALVLLLARRMDIVDLEAVPVHLFYRGLYYVPWLVKEVVLSNLDVAKRILSPGLPVAPEIQHVVPSQKTDLGRVLYANSITLTPGTVTLWVEPHQLVVHAIAREPAASLEGGAMDRRVTRLEGA